MTLKIAIDGPAGSGKTTTARLVAKRLGLLPVDTGAMYRAVAYACLKKGVDPYNEKEVEKILPEIEITQKLIGEEIHTFLNGEDVSGFLRTPQVSQIVSIVSQYRKVREKLVELQRKIAQEQDVVIEGRDIGTVVLKDADVKIFMVADLEERARRRYRELKSQGVEITYQEVLEQLRRRDELDSKREIAPLRVPEGAIIIDTTNKSIEEQVEEIIKVVRQRLNS